MKKKLLMLLLMIALLAVPAYAAGISVFVNGQAVDFGVVKPEIEGGRTLVPLRAIFEALGAEVNWFPDEKKIVANRKTTNLKLIIGQNKAYRNGNSLSLDVPAQIKNGRTLVPLRFVGEALGDTVVWDPKTKMITITSGNSDGAGGNDKDKNEMQVHFIDVGQGDSILVVSPNGSTMLIDGGEYSAGQKVVSYLKKAGVTSIDKVVATHAHSDHIGGLLDVLRSFKVGEVLDVGHPHTTKTYEDFLTLIDEKDIKYSNPRSGDSVSLDPALKIDVLNPSSDLSTNLNNQSIVLRMVYNEVSFLFTGDAEKEIEEYILSNNSNIKSQILKVGHHGSQTSSTMTFLNAVKPEIAVIQLAKDNSYGHPHQGALTNLGNVGAKVLRNDISGDIIVKTDGHKYSFNVIPTPAPKQDDKIPTQPVGDTSQDTGKYIGSIISDKFHYPDCRHAKNISPENEIWFKDKAEAGSAGYVSCGVCRP